MIDIETEDSYSKVVELKSSPIEEGIRHGRGVDKDTVENRYNVDLTQGVSNDAVKKSTENRYNCNEVDRYRTKPNEEGIRHGRGVDKDTAKSRNNVDLTKGFSEDAVRKYRAIVYRR